MRNSRRSAMWSSPRVWLIIAALIVLPFLIEFNARLAQSRELDAQQATLSSQIDAEAARHQALLKLQAWVNSDGYVEHWARLARLVRPGEIAVVPVPGQANSATSNVHSSPTNATSNDILSEWWTAFFGEAH